MNHRNNRVICNKTSTLTASLDLQGCVLRDVHAVTDVVKTSRSKGVASESLFVKRTFCMVDEGSREQPDVISWDSAGARFEIKDIEALKAGIFRKYHGETKFESFTRRLNLYGFQRERSRAFLAGSRKDILVFGHDNFLRDRPDLLTSVGIVTRLDEAEKSGSSSVQRSLSELEELQGELKNAARELLEVGAKRKSLIKDLQEQARSKEETTRRLEVRLQHLENKFILIGPCKTRRGQPVAPTQWPAWEKAPSSTIANLSSFSPSLLSLQTCNLEREISAMSYLSLPWEDEPTIPRSKKIKLFHKDPTVLDQDKYPSFGLSPRYTTPLFWHLPQPDDLRVLFP